MPLPFLLSIIVFIVMPFSVMAESKDATQVRLNCEMNERHSTAYDCKCIAAEYEKTASQESAKPKHIVVGELLAKKDNPCLRPERIYRYSIMNCATGFNYLSTQDHGKLGREKFCHCIADKTVEQLPTIDPKLIPHLAAGNVAATVACGKVKEYTVPADSPFYPQQLPPIADAPSGNVGLTDGEVYLVILNKNFDLDRLDRVRYLISKDFQNDRNYLYATPTENPILDLPPAIIKRGGEDGVIEQHASYSLVQSAYLNYRAILIKGPELKKLVADIQLNTDLKSADYYTLIGDEIFRVPDLPSKL